MKPFLILIVGLIFQFSTKTVAQVTEESGDLFIKISDIISGMPGDSGDDYTDPNASELSSWGAALDYLLTGNYALADASA
nr:hypothetical protein [Bacteroidota bacterium]